MTKKPKLPYSTNDELDMLIIDDIGYKTLTNKMYKSRKSYQPADPSQLKSFMPGNIQEVFVEEGAEVKEGDKLLILEAMKMKNVILAPFDGKVRSICVKIGEVVPKNHVLVVME
jgi:biotin carboxyl carrier protein